MKHILRAPPSCDFAAIHLLTVRATAKPCLADVELSVVLAHLTYFTRLFMLNYMLIILIEQQLDIGLIYLIYN